MEAELAERTQRGYAIETEIRENSGRLADLKLEVDRNHSQRRHNEERSNELALRAASSDAELGQARVRLTALEEELNSNRQSLNSAAADLAAAQQELEASQQQAVSAASALAELEQQQEQSRVAILESVAAISDLRNQLTQAEERMAAADREAHRLQAEMATARTQAETFGGERGQLAIEFESVSQRISGLTEEIAHTRELLELKRRLEIDSKNHLDTLRAEFATALGKRGSLEAVIAEHGYSTESVRRLFQSGVFQGGTAPVGVLADVREVDPRYEGVVEDFLRDELNYVVVKSWDAADEGLRMLRTDVDGRATFLVHPAEEHDSRPRRLWQVAGSHSSQAARRLYRARLRCRPRTRPGKSRSFFPIALRRMLPQPHRYRRQTACRRPAFNEARIARSHAPAGGFGTSPATGRDARPHPGTRDQRLHFPARSPGRRET